MTSSRRGFLLGLSSILAAPAIVRASSLMPVRAWQEPFRLYIHADTAAFTDTMAKMEELVIRAFSLDPNLIEGGTPVLTPMLERRTPLLIGAVG